MLCLFIWFEVLINDKVKKLKKSSRAVVFNRAERNNSIKERTLCSKCLISSHELVNLKEYHLQMCFTKSKLPRFCGGELISPSMTLDRKGLLLLL